MLERIGERKLEEKLSIKKISASFRELIID
jgi:hypothetical protein